MSAAAVSRTGWAAALGGSLLLHAGAAAAILPLLEEAGARPAPTAISFSDPPPDVIGSLLRQSETLSPTLSAPEVSPAEAPGRVDPAEGTALALPPLPADEATAESERSAEPAEPVAIAAARIAAPEAIASTLAGEAVQPFAPQAAPRQEPAERALPAEAGRVEASQAPALVSGVPVETLAAAAAPAVAAEVSVPSPPAPALAALPVLSPEPLAGALPHALPAETVAPTGEALDMASLLPATDDAAVPAVDAIAPLAETAPGILPSQPFAVAPAPPSSSVLPSLQNGQAAVAGIRAGEGLQPLTASPPIAAAVQAEAAPVAGTGPQVALALRPSLAAEAAAPSLQQPAGGVLEPVSRSPEVLASAAQSAAILPSLQEAAEERRVAVRRQAVTLAKGFNGGDCFAVVPTDNETEAVQFDAFSRDGSSMRRFAEAARVLGLDTETSLSNLSAAQCSAPVFARSLPNYPDFGLSLRLEGSQVPDHAFLAGRIAGAGSRPLQLLLVDDEGLVQSLQRFLTGEAEPTFRIPVNLTAGKVQTRQLLLALAVDRPLRLLEGEVSEDAPAFFRQLRAEIDLSGAKVDLALQAFDVQAAGDEAAPAPSGTSGEGR